MGRNFSLKQKKLLNSDLKLDHWKQSRILVQIYEDMKATSTTWPSKIPIEEMRNLVAHFFSNIVNKSNKQEGHGGPGSLT